MRQGNQRQHKNGVRISLDLVIWFPRFRSNVSFESEHFIEIRKYSMLVSLNRGFPDCEKNNGLLFAVIPDQRPTIHGTLAKYNVGDRVEVLCKSPFSLPGAKLVWLINDEEVRNSSYKLRSGMHTLSISARLNSSVKTFLCIPYN